MKLSQPIPLEEIQNAQARLRGLIIHTPLVRLETEQSSCEIYLKLENMQPTGSFKIRGAGNALLLASQQDLAKGVWTASAGNMAQNVAWIAKKMGILCSVVLPEDAPAVKVTAIAQLGARIIKVPFSKYQEIQQQYTYDGVEGLLVHPFADRHVMAGNGVLALEILQELPEVEAILVPYGGGGLSCGIASALRALRPDIKLLACEVQTGAPLAASLAAGTPVRVDFTRSFISGMGAPFVFPDMWPLVSHLIDSSLVVTLPEVCEAIRLLAETKHVIAEGAGAVSVAAALHHLGEAKRVACIVSGGNIDPKTLIKILEGYVPE